MDELYKHLFHISETQSIFRTASIKNEICRACTKESEHLHFIEIGVSRYKFIPFYPTYKDGFVICKRCKLKSYPGKMTTELWKKHNKIMEQYRYPLWTYLGSAAIAIIFLGIIIMLFTAKSIHNGPTDSSIKVASNIGNVIIVKEDPYYTSFKIINHRDDSIMLIPNKFSYQLTSPLSKVKEKDFIKEKVYKVHKDSITTSINGYKVYKVIYD